jgi:hypothetical protein
VVPGQSLNAFGLEVRNLINRFCENESYQIVFRFEVVGDCGNIGTGHFSYVSQGQAGFALGKKKLFCGRF